MQTTHWPVAEECHQVYWKPTSVYSEDERSLPQHLPSFFCAHTSHITNYHITNYHITNYHITNYWLFTSFTVTMLKLTVKACLSCRGPDDINDLWFTTLDKLDNISKNNTNLWARFTKNLKTYLKIFLYPVIRLVQELRYRKLINKTYCSTSYDCRKESY